MRRFSALSAGLFALAFAPATIAAPAQHGQLVLDVSHSPRVDLQRPVSAARDILLRAASAPHFVELSAVRTSHVGSARVYRFKQSYRGLPVLHCGGSLVADADGALRFATLRIEKRLPGSVVPKVDAAAAAMVAANRSGVPAAPANARLVIWPTPKGGLLAWSVLPPSLLPLPYVPLVVVDAVTGEVLTFQNLVQHKNLGTTYEFNPVATPDLIDVTLPIDDPFTAPQNALVNSFNCVDTKETKVVDFMGMNFTVHVCDLQQNATADAVTGDYTQHAFVDHTSGGDPFSEVAIFYHTNKAYDYFKAFDPAFELQGNSKPLFVVANLMLPAGLMSGDLSKMSDPNIPLEPFPNAFSSGWDPQYGELMSTLWPEITGASLMFGQGEKVDFALDGDVVYHEFGHSVVGSTLQLAGYSHLDSQGANVAPGAMNEGLADYFSSAMTGDAASGEYAGTEFGGDAIRHLDNDYSCPSHLAGEVHFDSQFWSAALWEVRLALPTPADKHSFDEALFTAMSAGPVGDASYEEVSELFVAAVSSSSLGTTVGQALRTAFETRGALPGCNRTWEWTGSAINSKESGMYGHFIAMGKSGFVIGSTLDYAPGLFQVHVPLPAGVSSVEVSFSQNVSGGGSALPIGGGDPYKPALLVGLGDPIAFDLSSGVEANTDQLVAVTKAGTKYSATIDIPAGTEDAYVMIVNQGDDDGYYTQLSFKTLSDTPDGGVVEDGGNVEPDAAPADAATDDGGAPPDPPQNGAAPADDSGGCGCAVPSSSDAGRGALALFAALLGSLVARRRKADRMRS